MKQLTKLNWQTWSALFLSLPTAFFIGATILKEAFGADRPYDAAFPLFERMGIKESRRLNINLFILFGPAVAYLLIIFPTLKIQWKFTNESFQFRFAVKERWLTLLVAAFSLSLLAI